MNLLDILRGLLRPAQPVPVPIPVRRNERRH